MQNKILVSAVTLSMSLILMAGSVKVNQSKAMPVWKSGGPVADGIPMPPPGKKPQFGSASFADGIPMPPPGKKPQVGNNTLADGIPMPPPGKKPQVSNATIVDGIPMPPPGKKPVTKIAA